MTVKVVKPIKVTDATLTSSTIPEPDPAQDEVEWEDRTQLTTIYSSLLSNDVDGMVSTDTGFVYAHGSFNSNTNEFMKINESDNSISYFHPNDPGSKVGYYDLSTKKIYYGTNIGKITIINTVDDSVTEIASPVGGFSDVAVSTGNGIVYYAGGSTSILRYDTSSGTSSQIGATSGSIRCGLVNSDGLIYFGGNDGVIYKLDPVDDSVTQIATIDSRLISSNAAGDGQIYFTSNDSRSIIKFNPATLDSSYVASMPGLIVDSTLGSDGFIYFSLDLFTQFKITRLNISDDSLVDITTPASGISPKIKSSENFKLYIGTNSSLHTLGQSYVEGDEVVVSSTHKRYRATTKTIEHPESGLSKVPPTWIEVGPTNRWAMFGTLILNKTKSASDFTVELTPTELYDTVAFFGMSGVENVRVEVIKDDLTVAYDETFNVIDLSSIIDHYTYVFYQLAYIDDFVVKDLPPFINSTLRITFEGSDMEVGVAPFGFGQDMGVTVIDTSSNTLDYSRQEFDEFGNLEFVERPVVSYNTYEVDVSKILAQGVERKLKSLRAENAVWVGDIGDGQSLITYGRYERSPVTYSNPSIVSYQVKVRGSI